MDLRTYLIRRGYWVYENGTLLPPLVNKDGVSMIRKFNLMEDRARTAYLVTYPNSGGCWVKYMMWSILLYDDPTTMNEIDTMLKRRIIFTCLEYSSPETGEPNFQELATMMSHCHLPLVISTNLSPDSAPNKMATAKSKLVFLVRNPKDVCVAQLRAILSEKDLQTRTDFERYADEFLDGHVPFGSWLDHTIKWWSQFANRKNYLFLTYEEVRQDLRATIEKLAKFLSVPLSKENITSICMKCCLSKVPWECEQDSNQKDDFLESINAGEVNEWKDYFTVSLSEKFEEAVKPKLAAAGMLNMINL
ncbi:sulfotransferase 1E1-like [Glandiceps talaboti]